VKVPAENETVPCRILIALDAPMTLIINRWRFGFVKK
jgi:hypothetical protein